MRGTSQTRAGFIVSILPTHYGRKMNIVKSSLSGAGQTGMVMSVRFQ